jgi:hypothetical protein
MKSFLLAATVAAGLLCSAGSADAQFRRSNIYVAPSVNSFPTYIYPTYGYPAYYNGGLMTTSYYAPAYSSGSVFYSGGTYYDPTLWGSVPYTYGSSYYSGYNGLYGSSYYGSTYYGGYRRSRWGW